MERSRRAGHKRAGARLRVNETEAALVRLVFDKYPVFTSGGLAKWLNTSGYRLPCKSPARRAKYGRTERLFDAKAITDLISNELYTGTLSWWKTTKVQGQEPEEFRHYMPRLQIISFEAFNGAQAIRKDRRRVPPRSQGSSYVYFGLFRCPECGGRTVGKRQWHKSYDYRETKRYECQRYHIQGRTACKGWSAFEQTVNKAVPPFLVDLLENKLRIQEHLQDAPLEMERSSIGDRTQNLQAEIVNAEYELAKAQDGYLAEVFTVEEAQSKSFNLREIIERAERKLAELESAADLRQELTAALRIMEKPLAGFLESLHARHLPRVCRAVFEHFTVRASG